MNEPELERRHLPFPAENRDLGLRGQGQGLTAPDGRCMFASPTFARCVTSGD